MNFEEHAAKPLLTAAGIAVPESRLARTPEEAAEAARDLGAVVVKAQVPAGKRGKAGGIKTAECAEEAKAAAEKILGLEIAGHTVEKVLVEERSDIAREFYAAILNDPATKGPLVMFSTEGGMDIEDVAEKTPGAIRQAKVDIRQGFGPEDAQAMLEGLDLGDARDGIADVLAKLYAAYRDNDAELLEINPLVVTASGGLVALDCKFVIDDSALKRHRELAATGTPDKLTELEARGEEAGIKYIELDGDVGVLANGAGLTMTTMDVIRHHGGRPANFCEIGGDAYTKARTALEMVLDKPGVRSLVVNFCGAFARCDVMMEGLLEAWDEVRPELPVFFSIAGTGDEEAIEMLKRKLGMDPLPDMDAACQAAAEAAKKAAAAEAAKGGA
ncbi:MAG: acetate--CoA ligase family protein [Proteobacteria bacterium]|nr:acetate--CoA ligase family protein [Pseudomonadota bacterium]